MSSQGLVDYKLAFELGPIILTNGVAQNMPGQALSIEKIVGSWASDRLDDWFANFVPLPQATLVDQDVGTYPFANQAVAANAVISKPLAISLRMIAPVKRPGGYPERLSIMTTLQSTLQKHNASGGTYTVATPSGYYVNCLLLALRDVTAGDSAQVQTDWQWDFVKPLLTLADAEAAQNDLMAKISSGTQINGQPAWSGGSGSTPTGTVPSGPI